jgi:hypothetical protein
MLKVYSITVWSLRAFRCLDDVGHFKLYGWPNTFITSLDEFLFLRSLLQTFTTIQPRILENVANVV